MDPIAFTVRNADDKASAYIGTDPTRNVLTLIVTNGSGGDLALRPGTAVAEPPPGGGPSSLYLNFGDLVAADAIPHIAVSAPGWAAVYFATPSPAFALTPSPGTTNFAVNSSIRISLTNFPVAGPARPSGVSIDYYGLGSLDPDSGTAAVLVVAAPAGQQKLALNHGFVSDATVYVTSDERTPIKNTFVFYLSNPSPSDPLVATETKWGDNPPELLLSFVPGKPPGYGAMAAIDHLKDTQVGLAQVYQDRWDAKQDLTGNVPFWRLQPKAHEVLGTGETATVEFRITELVTELQPGMTQMYVQYTNIPGYDDGYVTFQIEKKLPTAGILQFLSLTPATVNRGDPVTLAWQTFDASTLTLTYMVDGLSREQDAPDEIPFNGTFNPPAPSLATTYTLEAFDYAGNKAQSQVTIGVVEPPPRIGPFSAEPPRANLLDDGAITLTWMLENAENAKQLTLIALDENGQEIHQVLDLAATSQPARVYRSGGVPFKLRVDSAITPGDHDTKGIMVETWEDAFTLTEQPAGAILPFGGERLEWALREGWLLCDGSALPQHDYPDLFDAIRTSYGGDGTTNFALPDLRGMFLRGVDEWTHRDGDFERRYRQATNHMMGPMLASWQPDQTLADDFSPTQSETSSKNVAVHYLIASGRRDGRLPPARPYRATPMAAATLLDDGSILGVGADALLYTRPSLAGDWSQIPGSGSVIGVSQLRDGRILGVGTDHELYTRASLTSAWSHVTSSGAVKAVTVLNDGTILGVGMDNTLYTRAALASQWTQVRSSGDVIAIMQRPDGNFVGVGTNLFLYVRTALDSGWQLIANSGSVIAVAQLAYGVILGIDKNYQLFTRASLTSPWVQVK